MGNKNTDFLEKAAVGALSIPAAMMAGKMAGEIYQGGITPIDQRGKPSKYDEDVKRIKEKYPEEKKEPSGGDNKSTGSAKAMKKGGSVSSASKRADGCAIKGKTRGKMV